MNIIDVQMSLGSAFSSDGASGGESSVSFAAVSPSDGASDGASDVSKMCFGK